MYFRVLSRRVERKKKGRDLKEEICVAWETWFVKGGDSGRSETGREVSFSIQSKREKSRREEAGERRERKAEERKAEESWEKEVSPIQSVRSERARKRVNENHYFQSAT